MCHLHQAADSLEELEDIVGAEPNMIAITLPLEVSADHQVDIEIQRVLDYFIVIALVLRVLIHVTQTLFLINFSFVVKLVTHCEIGVRFIVCGEVLH